MKRSLILTFLALITLSACSQAPLATPTTDTNTGEKRLYTSKDPEECSRIRFACIPGRAPFSDETGCGCELIDESTPEGSGSEEGVTSGLPVGEYKLNESGLFYGDFYVRGYASTETVAEPFCEQDCATYDYVNFNIVESGNKDFLAFLESNRDNAYVKTNRIGLGCVENNLISYSNHSDEQGMKEFSLSAELSQAIMGSSAAQPIALHLKKLPLSGGQGAPACYSHITSVEVLTE